MELAENFTGGLGEFFMKHPTTRLSLVLLSISVLLVPKIEAQSQVKDVPGWREAKWGMTEGQVLAAFKGEALMLDRDKQIQGDKVHASISIPKLEVEGIMLVAKFRFDNDSNKLEWVTLEPVDDPPYPTQPYFERLEPLLTSKYGQPSYKTSAAESRTSNGMFMSIGWNFSTTDIELTYSDSNTLEMKKFDRCVVFYKAHHDNKL
jgi:hypothetical protein